MTGQPYGALRDPFEDQVRASLQAHALDAPAGDLLADRVINAVEQSGKQRYLRGWGGFRAWTLPVVAAGSVAAVAAAVAMVIHVHPTAAPVPPAFSVSPTTGTGAPTTDAPTLGASATATPSHAVPVKPVPDDSGSGSPAPTGHNSTATQVGSGVPKGMRVADVTFISPDAGWALGSALCTSGGTARCTALLHTTDGTNWSAVTAPPVTVAGATCTSRCAQHVRFADASTGYVYGEHTLAMTTDGGRSWHFQAGGALELETLNQNVVRVTDSHSGCPGPCDVRVQTAAIGSVRWTTRALPGGTSASVNSVQLVRAGNDAYLLATGPAAGGAGQAESTLWRSSDNGASWRNAGEPCPQSSGEVDSSLVTAAPQDSATVLCARRGVSRWYVAVSSDSGADWAATSGALPAPVAANLLAGDPRAVLLAGGQGLARSTDGGRSWQRVDAVTGSLSFMGFENDSVARAVSADGRTIWTTRDGGTTWVRTSLH